MRIRRNRCVALPLAVLILGFSGGLSTAYGQSRQEIRVRKVELTGNLFFSDRTLKSLMKSSERSIFRPLRRSVYREDFLRADIVSIKALYHKNGFLAVQVQDPVVRPDSTGGRVDIWIHVVEGPRVLVGEVTFSGIEVLDTERIKDVTYLKPGNAFDPSQVQADAQRILSVYADEGRVFATVNHNVAIEQNRARIHFDIAEGPPVVISEIGISGNRETKNFVVQREITFKEGELYSQRKIVNSEQRIYDTGLFRNVRFSMTNVDSVNNRVGLDLRVNEKKAAWIDGGVGYSSGELLKLFSEWGNRNVGGTARTISLRGEAYVPVEELFDARSLSFQRDRLALTFIEPWLLGTRTALVVTASHESRLEVTEQAFRETERGFKISLRRKLAPFAEGDLSYNYPWVYSTRVVGRRYFTRSLSTTLRRDTRDNPLDPRKGSFQESSAKYAGGLFGGDFDYWRVTLNSSWYLLFASGRCVFATRILTGVVEPFGDAGRLPSRDRLLRVPFADEFRTGGSTTIRGYAEEQLQIVGDAGPLGALAMAVGNLELRVRAHSRFGFAAFVDAGNAWASTEDIVPGGFKFSVDESLPRERQVRYSGGLGLRIVTPVGPFRIDYAVRLKQVPGDAGGWGRVHLSLGQAF